jgi:hypothetical protein
MEPNAAIGNDQTFSEADDYSKFEAELEGRNQPPSRETKSDATAESGAGSEPAETLPETQPEEAKLSPKAQARFDKITREKHELQRQLEEARKAKPAEKSVPAPAATASEIEFTFRAPSDMETLEEYLAARDKAQAKFSSNAAAEIALTKLRAEQEEARKSEVKKTAEQTWKAQQDEARTAHPDYDTVLADVDVTDDIYRAIREQKDAALTLYRWGKLPEAERERIMNVETSSGRIFEALSAIKGKESPATTKPQVSKASKPPSKVAGAGAQTDPEESDDFLVFAAAEDAKRRR